MTVSSIPVGEDIAGSGVSGPTHPVATEIISAKEYQLMRLAGADGAAITPASIPESITDGRATVDEAGARVPIVAASLPCKKIDLVAEHNNAGIVVVGGANCVAEATSRQGIPLAPGDFYSVEITDAANLYIDAVEDGDGITFLVWA